jgi:phage terminase small subunit
MASHESAKPLAPRQQRFVEEYLVDLNATQAALRAGYSPRTARSQASRMLTCVNVQAALAAAQRAYTHRVHLTQDAVLAEIALLQRSDVTHYHIDDHGNVALAPQAPPDAMRAVSSLKKKITHTDAGVTYETTITLWSKPAAVKMAGEHLGLFKGAEQALPDIHIHIEAARERLTDRLTHLARRHAQDASNGH